MAHGLRSTPNSWRRSGSTQVWMCRRTAALPNPDDVVAVGGPSPASAEGGLAGGWLVGAGEQSSLPPSWLFGWG